MSPSDAAVSEVVTATRTYRATPEAAFDAWTDPALLAQWFGPPGFRARVLTHELRVGGTWLFLMEGGDGDSYRHFGSFVEIARPHRLVFTWASEGQPEAWLDADGNPTLVTVAFEARPPGVTVTITHERLASADARRALTGGWNGSLTCLGEFLAGEERAHEPTH